MGGIEAAPTQARQKHFGPGMQMSLPIGRVGLSLVAAYEPCGHPEAAAGRHEQDGEVAARAAADGQRVGSAFDPDAAFQAGEQRVWAICAQPLGKFRMPTSA